MRPVTGGLLGRAKRRVADDLEADPYLVYILGLAALLAGFWIWHTIPNFATRDERWRIVDPMAAVGIFAGDPGIDSLMEAMSQGRSFGATFYIYGVALIPVFVAAFLTGQLEAFTAFPDHGAVDLWALWNRTPRWIWTWGILLSRLVNVAFAVGSVYLTYRIGTTMRDRSTGRLAAVLLSFTWGFLVLAHEAGEDVPALFFLLLVFYLGLRYAETGDDALFLAGCVFGGVAIAIKLTAGVCVILLGASYLLRVRNAGPGWRDALVRPRLLAVGAVLGAATIFVAFPSVLASGLELLVRRIGRGTTGKSDPHGWRVEPTWWWFLRGYLNGMGLVLFVGTLGGLAASVPRLRERSLEADGVILSLVGIGAHLLLYSRWAYVRTHHLLPTFPLLVLVLAAALVRLYDHDRRVARPVVAVLLLSSGVYAGVGDLGYATQPRDGATDWLRSNAPPNATVETYPEDPQEGAIPHGMSINRPTNRVAADGGEPPGPTEWMLNVTERCPEYVQLHYYEGVLYLAPDDWSERARRLSDPRRTEYFRDLLAGDTYPYTVAATFGPRPPFLDAQPRDARLPELLHVGLFPRTIQYGDPQDFGIDQYTVILVRSGRCGSSEGRSPSSGANESTSVGRA